MPRSICNFESARAFDIEHTVCDHYAKAKRHACSILKKKRKHEKTKQNTVGKTIGAMGKEKKLKKARKQLSIPVKSESAYLRQGSSLGVTFLPIFTFRRKKGAMP